MLALPLFAGVAGASLLYPFGSGPLLAALVMYGALVWRFPAVALPALLALLPLLDFSLSSGWLLLNEFDLLVAVTLGVLLLRVPDGKAGAALSPIAKGCIALAAVSFVVSAAIGLWPLAPLDANALFGPYTSWSALRRLKGFVWALVLLPFLIDQAQEPQRLERRLTAGMVLGLAGVVLVALWQRETFAGLFDFSVVYRVEGPFPELHTGGGDVHAYLIAALPFTLSWACERRSAPRIGVAAALFVLATYAIGVTYTRGAYVGYAMAFVVVGVALARYLLPARQARLGPLATVAAVAVIGLVVLAPIVSGTFMLARFSGTQAEAATRTHHWTQAIGMMEKNLTTTLFGMGLGTFPKTLVMKQPDAASATFSFQREAENGYLRLGSGRPLYLDQRVDLVPGQTYTVALDMRSASLNARLDAMLCEKSIQYSFRCASATFMPAATGVWEPRQAGLNTNDIGAGSWLFRRPVALSLVNLGPRTVIDVDRVRLLDAAGHDVLVNGDFSAGGARWFFAADDHLPWHVFNLWVAILFEQGWLGVLAVAGVVALALRNAAVSMWEGDLHAGMILSALVGFLAVGVTESLFDGPRVTTLFFLLVFATLIRRPSLSTPCPGGGHG